MRLFLNTSTIVLRYRGLKNDLWYQQCDYEKFRKEHKDFLQRQSIYKCDQTTNMLVDAYDFEEDSKV